jgi:hypothetical protein
MISERLACSALVSGLRHAVRYKHSMHHQAETAGSQQPFRVFVS